MKPHAQAQQDARRPDARNRTPMATAHLLALLIIGCCCCKVMMASAATNQASLEQAGDRLPGQQPTVTPANHRMAAQEGDTSGDTGASIETGEASRPGRQSRQYDSAMGSSSSLGQYAALAGDTAAYVGPTQLAGGAGSSAAYSAAASTGSYDGQQAGAGGYATSGLGSPMYHHHAHDPLMGRGYPAYGGTPMQAAMGPPPPPPMVGSPLSAMFAAGSSPGSMFPLMAKGFDVSEIICTAIAVAIGAVIVGAPFILLYLFVMNQMGGGGGGLSGPGGMGPNGGSISLTGPSSSTNVSGRKKRQTSFPEALFRQLSPLMNNEQLIASFKMLLNSLAKYQVQS